MSFEALQNAEYINIETFRKTGVGVRTPTWQAPENGKLYVWTQAESGKVKRIRNNARVNVCVCDRVGNPQSDWASASARVLDDEAALAAQQKRLYAKYGEAFERFNGPGRQRVVIEINPA